MFLSCKGVPICDLSTRKMHGTRHMSDYGFFQILKYLQIHEISWRWEPSLSIEIHWFYMNQIVMPLKNVNCILTKIFHIRSSVEFPTCVSTQRFQNLESFNFHIRDAKSILGVSHIEQSRGHLLGLKGLAVLSFSRQLLPCKESYCDIFFLFFRTGKKPKTKQFF